MKNYKKITVAGIASIAAVAALAGSASASTAVIGGNVSGSDGILRLTREITNVVNPVSNVYTYTVTEKAGNPGTATGAPTTGTITFNNAAVSGGKATATVDFDFTNFSADTLGDYYYTVTETTSSDNANYPKTTKTYDMVVSVLNQLDNNNVPNGNFDAHVVGLVVDGSDKVDFSISTPANRTYISASEKVTGTASDPDTCFQYKINIPAKGSVALAGDTYTVSTSSTCANNPSSITVGGSSNYVYLKNNDSVTIGLDGAQNEMPIGVDYTIQLMDKKGYENPYFNDVQQSSLTTPSRATVAVSDSSFNASNTTAIRLNKNADVNTGIIMNILPFILMAGFAGAGIAIVTKSKQKENR